MKLRMKDLAPPQRRIAQYARRREKLAAREQFEKWCRINGLGSPHAELQFHPTRKWAFDFAWKAERVALEIDGAIWTQGRHTRGSGRLGDMEKQSEAAALGWRIIYRTPQNLYSDETADLIRRALAG